MVDAQEREWPPPLLHPQLLPSNGSDVRRGVLRSMAYALLMHEGDSPTHRDSAADRPWRRNQGLTGKIVSGWQEGKLDGNATVGLLAVLRQLIPRTATKSHGKLQP